MSYDTHDTIGAIASASGGAARGVVRVSGPDAVALLAKCFTSHEAVMPLASVRVPRRVAGSFHIDGYARQAPLDVPGDLLLWPTRQSYTREPAAEFHTIGSPPLLAAIVEQLGRAGVRPAEPGEFTLRAFLAGRIDLTQAEAVLGVVDARDRDDLDAALAQLAGGLSQPLRAVREQLLALLAELEAGLDFAEEDVEFISREDLALKLNEVRDVVATTLLQLAQRTRSSERPRVAIVGPPNAGKSSLFNALVARYGASGSSRAIVSPQPGATRDYLSASLDLGGALCELLDTAGEDESALTRGGIESAAQRATARRVREADLRLRCIEAPSAPRPVVRKPCETLLDAELLVLTKSDLLKDGDQTSQAAGAIFCSSITGDDLDVLAERLRSSVFKLRGEGRGAVAAATSARCAGSLREAKRALTAALELIGAGGDELIAAEIRVALDALGDVIGATCADDVLDRVFRQFCIGK